MRTSILTAALLLYPAVLFGQAPKPGSSGGGDVGPSVSRPDVPLGTVPPGTPSGETAGDRALRDAAGQHVIGRTETPTSPVPGDTKGLDSGVRK